MGVIATVTTAMTPVASWSPEAFHVYDRRALRVLEQSLGRRRRWSHAATDGIGVGLRWM